MEPAETSLRPRPAVGSEVETKLGTIPRARHVGLPWKAAATTKYCSMELTWYIQVRMDATLQCLLVLSFAGPVWGAHIIDVCTMHVFCTAVSCTKMEDALDRRLVLYTFCTENRSTKHGPGHRGYGP